MKLMVLGTIWGVHKISVPSGSLQPSWERYTKYITDYCMNSLKYDILLKLCSIIFKLLFENSCILNHLFPRVMPKPSHWPLPHQKDLLWTLQNKLLELSGHPIWRCSNILKDGVLWAVENLSQVFQLTIFITTLYLHLKTQTLVVVIQ